MQQKNVRKYNLFKRHLNCCKTNFTFFLFTLYKSEWKEHSFNEEKLNKSNFYRIRKPFIMDDIDINKILISKKEPYGKEKLT